MVLYYILSCVHEPLEWVGREPRDKEHFNQPTLALMARHLHRWLCLLLDWGGFA